MSRIRQASLEDVAPLAGLMQQAVVLQQQFAGYDTLQADVDWSAYVRGQFVRHDRTIFVAEDRGQLVGFLVLRRSGYAAAPRPRTLWHRLWRREASPPPLPLQPLTWGVIDECFVTAAWLSPRHRQCPRRARTRLLKAQGMLRIELGVLVNNTEAAAFWTQCGFQPYRVLMYTQLT
jgi:ribosomal protein S18 acetylase RimI-like enzyme